MSFRCVPVGKLVAHIVEFEQVGLPRAAYGKKLLLQQGPGFFRHEIFHTDIVQRFVATVQG